MCDRTRTVQNFLSPLTELIFDSRRRALSPPRFPGAGNETCCIPVILKLAEFARDILVNPKIRGLRGDDGLSHNDDLARRSDRRSRLLAAFFMVAATLSLWCDRTSQAGPIVINSVSDLQNIQNNLSGDYVLGSNIDASGVNFAPVGDSSVAPGAASFTGTFDGNGRTISNLSINVLTHGGLFGVLGPGGTIANVNLSNVNIFGGSDTGGLVGQNSGGTVTNSSVSGVVSGRGDGEGGLIGFNSIGSIYNSFSTANVSGLTASGAGGLVGYSTSGTIGNSYATGSVFGLQAGGLVGDNGGVINNSYATGGVNSYRGVAGGLVGNNYGTISQSRSSGNISSTYDNGGGIAGGLAGDNAGQILQSFASGSVVGVTSGGLVGNDLLSQSGTGGTIKQSYSTASVFGPGFGGVNSLGGLIGISGVGAGSIDQTYAAGPVQTNDPFLSFDRIGGFAGLGLIPNSGIALHSYWDQQNTGQSHGTGGGSDLGAISLATAQLQSGSLPSGFDPNVWTATAGRYPSLIANPAPLAVAPPPTPLQLANASKDVYSGTAAPTSDQTSPAYTFLRDDCGLLGCASGLRAAAYQSPDGSQIIVAIRGTVLSIDNLKDLFADASFLANTPSPEIVAEYRDAATFLRQIRSQYPNATITLTGHSLGGAIAQVLGAFYGLTTDTFNAPGASALYQQLTGTPVTPVTGNVITNYRIYGDQYGLYGTPFPGTTTFTLPSTVSNLLIDANTLEYVNVNHDIRTTVLTQVSALEAGTIAPETSSGFNMTAELVANYLVPLVHRIENNAIESTFIGSALAFQDLFFDPSGGTDFSFIEDPGSPNIACLDIPALSGVGSYNVRDEVDSTWSSFQNLPTGGQICFGAAVDGIDFQPLDLSGQGFDLAEQFLFAASFSSSGDFSGTLTETIPASVPEPPTLALLIIPLAGFLLIARRHRIQ